jgi:hypothetical protein
VGNIGRFKPQGKRDDPFSLWIGLLRDVTANLFDFVALTAERGGARRAAGLVSEKAPGAAILTSKNRGNSMASGMGILKSTDL